MDESHAGASEPTRNLRLGTRGSALALTQAAAVRTMLEETAPDISVTIQIVQSLGDLERDQPLSAIGEQGIFTHALEQALRRQTIDLAVHSAKDLPSTLPPDCTIAAVPPRANPLDCLVTPDGRPLAQLREGAVLGTGSPRRIAQLRHARPDLQFAPLRGNVDTRRRAALEGKFDGVILAAAGLQRLGLLDEHAAVLPAEDCLPQAGQGALALEIRASDETSISIVRAIHDPCAGACVEAERAVLAGLAAGCQAPVAAYATIREGRLTVQGLVAGPVGEQVLRTARAGAPEDAEALGKAVARDLRRLGADTLLEQSRRLGK